MQKASLDSIYRYFILGNCLQYLGNSLINQVVRRDRQLDDYRARGRGLDIPYLYSSIYIYTPKLLIYIRIV